MPSFLSSRDTVSLGTVTEESSDPAIDMDHRQRIWNGCCRLLPALAVRQLDVHYLGCVQTSKRFHFCLQQLTAPTLNDCLANGHVAVIYSNSPL